MRSSEASLVPVGPLSKALGCSKGGSDVNAKNGAAEGSRVLVGSRIVYRRLLVRFREVYRFVQRAVHVRSLPPPSCVFSNVCATLNRLA